MKLRAYGYSDAPELPLGVHSPTPMSASRITMAGIRRLVVPCGFMFPQPGRACSVCGRDLWDVAHFVSAGPVAICELCIEAATGAVARASPKGGRELFLPPRTFGDAGSEEDAASIADAFRAVFSGSSTADPRESYVEGGQEMLALLAEAGQRVPTRDITVRIDRIRFVTSDEAEVRFQLLGMFEGRSIRRDGRWLVSSDTIGRVTASVGVMRRPHRTWLPRLACAGSGSLDGFI
jgi:hypothetical protein